MNFNITKDILQSFIEAAWENAKILYPDFCDDYDSGEYDMDVVLDSITKVVVEGWKLVKVDGFGGEDEGEFSMVVWALVREDDPAIVRTDKTIDGVTLYLRLNGYYSSYDGSTWEVDDVKFVDPKFVQRTNWVSR